MIPQSQTDLTIVIPAFREERRIGKTLDELAKFINNNSFFRTISTEIVVVAAEAGDKTQAIVRAKKDLFKDLRLLEPGPKVGKGRDVQYGMVRAHGNYIVFMDADLATPLKYIPSFYKYSEDKYDLVIGVRNLRKHHPSYLRRLVSNIGNILYRFAAGVWVEDSQCGFKMFTKHAAHVCFDELEILGWGFDMEVLARAKANRLSTKTVRINDWVSVPDGVFVDGKITNTLKSLKELGVIFVRRLQRAYSVKKGPKL